MVKLNTKKLLEMEITWSLERVVSLFSKLVLFWKIGAQNGKMFIFGWKI